LYNIRKKSIKVRRAKEIAAMYQQREGRHKIRVKVLLTPDAGDVFCGCHSLLCNIGQQIMLAVAEP